MYTIVDHVLGGIAYNIHIQCMTAEEKRCYQ